MFCGHPKTYGLRPRLWLLSILNSVESACLKAHNDRRILHGANPLIWDDTLVQHAQVWANHLAATDTFQHDPNLNGEGENLAFFNGVASDCTNALVLW